MFPGSDSFHPLLAEVTQNETADPSMIFHLPEHVTNSPEGQPASGERSVSTHPEEFETHYDPSSSEQSPECLRTEEPSVFVTASPDVHESFSQLITSQYHPDESVLLVGDTRRTDVELTALSLANLTMCDDAPPLAMPQPEGADADNTSERLTDSVPFSNLCAGALKSEQGPDLRNVIPISDKILVSLCLLVHLL